MPLEKFKNSSVDAAIGNAVFTDTTYSNFTGADGTNAGAAGLVPAPAATDNTKCLLGDGTFGTLGGRISTTPTTQFADSAASGFGWTATDNGVVVIHNGGSTAQTVCCIISNTFIGFLDHNFAADDIHSEMVAKGTNYWIVKGSNSVTANFHKFI